MDHFYHKIPGFMTPCLRDLYFNQVAGAMDGSDSVFVEVGTFLGASTACMAVEILNSGKKISFHTVDSWTGNPELASLFVKRDVYAAFLDYTAPVSHLVKVHKMSSTEAAGLFEDRSVDFCFLDGAHDYDSVKADIEAWLPRMKPGGLLAGHDYEPGFMGVVHAVNDVLGMKRTALSGVCWMYSIPSTAEVEDGQDSAPAPVGTGKMSGPLLSMARSVRQGP